MKNTFIFYKRYSFIFLVFLIFIECSLTQAQSFDWAFKSARYSNGLGGDMVTDKSGNILITGEIIATCDFNPDTAAFNLSNSTGYSYNDFFVAKYNKQGQFINAIVLGGKNMDFVEDINVDQNNNVIVSGLFTDTVDFDPGPGQTVLTADHFDPKVFILKLDSNLNFVWVKSLDPINPISPPFGRSYNAVDNDGNVYSTGFFYGTVDFNPGTGVDTITASSCDQFIVKLDSAGNFIWVKDIRGALGGLGIAIDNYENIYTVGYFLGTVDFDPGQGIFNLTMDSNTVGPGMADIFVSKYDSTGDFIWAKRVGGKNVDNVTSLHLINDQSILVGGYFRDTANFDPGNSNFLLYCDTNSLSNSFILKLDSAGNFNWVKQFVSNVNSIYHGTSNIVTDLTADTNGNIYITDGFYGGISDSVDFDPGSNTYFLSPSLNPIVSFSNYDSNIALVKLNSAGDFVSAIKIADSSSGCWNTRIIVQPSGQVIVFGSFNDTIDVDPGSGYYPLLSDSLGSSRYFLLSLNDTTTHITKLIPKPNGLLIFPNPASKSVTVVSSSEQNIVITDMLGKIVAQKHIAKCESLQTTIDVSSFSPGVYFIKAGNSAKKFIKH